MPSPALYWLLQMLASLTSPADVLVRPDGDRRRENKLHLSTVDIALLGQLLDLLRERVGPVSVEGNPGTRRGDAPDAPDMSCDAEGDAPTLTPQASDILALLGREGRPLLGKVIAARLGVKYSSRLRACLADLVERGHLRHGKAGYWLASPAQSDTGDTDGDEPQCTEEA